MRSRIHPRRVRIDNCLYHFTYSALKLNKIALSQDDFISIIIIAWLMAGHQYKTQPDHQTTYERLKPYLGVCLNIQTCYVSPIPPVVLLSTHPHDFPQLLSLNIKMLKAVDFQYESY